jgi:hypothetical protein
MYRQSLRSFLPSTHASFLPLVAYREVIWQLCTAGSNPLLAADALFFTSAASKILLGPPRSFLQF